MPYKGVFQVNWRLPASAKSVLSAGNLTQGVQREGPLRTQPFTVMAVPAFDREFSVPALKDYNRYRQIKQ